MVLATFGEGNKVSKAVCIDRFAFQYLQKDGYKRQKTNSDCRVTLAFVFHAQSQIILICDKSKVTNQNLMFEVDNWEILTDSRQI